MKLPLLVGVLALLVVGGVGLYVTDFTAYLGNDPATCNNCHVMDAAYEGWYHGGHQDWAACVDCHVPHPLVEKYIAKGLQGFRHVSAFSLGRIPSAIRATAGTRAMIQENCIRCHAATVADIGDGGMPAGDGRYCFDCHRAVAHGARGVSLLPYQDDLPYRERKP